MKIKDAYKLFSKLANINVENYSMQDLKKVYVRLVKKNHPDRGGDESIMAEINSLYDFISQNTPQQKEKVTNVNTPYKETPKTTGHVVDFFV